MALLLAALLAIVVAVYIYAIYSTLASVEPAAKLISPGQIIARGNAPAIAPVPGTTIATPRTANTLLPATPLPAVSEPAALHQDFLLAEIGKGNTRAACRYAVELKRCQTTLPMIRRLATGDFSVFTSAGIDIAVSDERKKKSMESMRKHVETDGAFCEGFSPKSKLSAWTHLYIAASGGHVPSAFFFATFTPSLPFEFMAHRDDWELRKQYGELFLRSAADAGYAPAVVRAASSYSEKFPGRGELEDVTPINHYEAAKYAFAARAWKVRENWTSLSQVIERSEKAIGAAEVARARDEARKLVESWNYDPSEYERSNDSLNFNGRNGGFCSD